MWHKRDSLQSEPLITILFSASTVSVLLGGSKQVFGYCFGHQWWQNSYCCSLGKTFQLLWWSQVLLCDGLRWHLRGLRVTRPRGRFVSCLCRACVNAFLGEQVNNAEAADFTLKLAWFHGCANRCGQSSSTGSAWAGARQCCVSQDLTPGLSRDCCSLLGSLYWLQFGSEDVLSVWLCPYGALVQDIPCSCRCAPVELAC